MYKRQVHRIGAGGQGLTQLAAVRRGAGLLAVHDIGGDGKGREGVDGVSVQGVLFQLTGERPHYVHRLVVGPVAVSYTHLCTERE